MAPLVNGTTRLRLSRLTEQGFVQRRLLGICAGSALAASILGLNLVLQLLRSM